MVHSTAETKYLRLKWRIAINRWENQLTRWIDVAKTSFDPNQPRVPTGNPRGGQWTGGGGGGGHTGSRNESRILPDAKSDNASKLGTRVAQAGRRRTPRRIIINGVSHTPTPGQAARHAAAKAKARATSRQVREIEPKWKPRPGAFENIDGQVNQFRAEAAQAQARLRELARQNPSQLINTYRTGNNARDLFGNETWPRNRDTVSVTAINRVPIVGVNSSAPTYTMRDRNTARVAVDTLVVKYPDVMNTINIGRTPNNAIYHAEATVLLRAARANGGSLAGQRFEVHTDRNMCPSCQKVLPLLSRELGNPTVTFVSPNGTRRTLRNGSWAD